MKKKKVINKIPLQTAEKTFALNFISNFSDVVEFSATSWNLAILFLNSIEDPDKLTPNQKVAIFMISKSARLLRAINMLAINGYWPEAEIILRTLFETQCTVMDILQDNSHSKAKDWLRNKKWRIGHVLRKFESKLGKVYGRLSRYPHSSVLSISSYVKFGRDKKFSVELGPLMGKDNFIHSAKVLGIAALMNAAICEVSAPYFKLQPQWERKHDELMKMEYFQKQSNQVKKWMSEEARSQN